MLRNARGEADSGGPTTNQPNRLRPGRQLSLLVWPACLWLSTRRCEDALVVVVVVVVFAREQPNHVVEVAL